MSSYKDLIAERAKLDALISEARENEVGDAIAMVQEIIAEYELTQQDVFPNAKTIAQKAIKKASEAKVAPKYRDPATGQTWTGRGKAPKWISEFSSDERAQFLIQEH